MKRLAALCLSLCLTTALAQDNVPEIAAARANNSFAIDIYPRLARNRGNFVFSPYSAETILALAWAGARGDTAKQMAKALHLGDVTDKSAIHNQFTALMAKFKAGQTNASDNVNETLWEGVTFQLSTANALWLQQGFPFRDDFLKIGRGKFGAALNQVDFMKASDSARQQINDWVRNETHGRIEDIVNEKNIDSSTRLVLASAIYFKARWRYTFDNNQTRPARFHLGPKKNRNVPMMNVQAEFSYGESKTYQVVELPYFSGKLSMIIALPKDPDGLAEWERSLNDDELTQLLSWVKPQEVNVSLPRFKFASEVPLQDTLQEMGMTDAFLPDVAKFSGISDESIFLSAVLQKAFIAVDEEGTEAAAATAVASAAGGVPTPPQPIFFRADHPFLFFIRHNETGAILFIGRVADPSKG